MVDAPALSSRLSALAGYLAELRTFREIGEERFVAEPGLHHLAERYLHLACETVLDIANHLIADLGARQATSYRDAMRVLAEQRWIDEPLAERLADWMGFRNVLVHLYLDIDHRQSFSAIRDDLGDLEAFASAMARFLPTE